MEVNHMIFYICHFLLSSSSSFFFQNFNVRIMSWSPTCYYFGILDRQFKSEIEKDKIALHGWWQYYVPQIIIFRMCKWCVLGRVHLKVHSENHTEYNYTRNWLGTQAGSLGRGVLPRPWNYSQPASQMKLNSCWVRLRQGRIQDFFRRGCTRLLL